MPGFSLIAYASAIETLRLANQLAQKELYQWEVLTPNQEDVAASCGINISAQPYENTQLQYDVLFICGGESIESAWSDNIDQYLQTLNEQGVALGALCTGSYILAKAGLIEGHSFTIHWEDIPKIRNEFPHLNVTDDIYEIDQQRFTSAGGTTPIDMFHHIISQQHGRELAAEICETILIDHVRSMSERQSIPINQKIGDKQPQLAEIIKLMEMNLELPLTTPEISELLNISRRQIERLFRLYLNTAPTRYYLDLRLRYARRLLLQSEKRVSEIATLTGFTTSVHFSQSYRKKYDISPMKERRSIINTQPMSR